MAILTDGESARRLVTDRFTMTRSRVILVVAGVIMVLAVLGWEHSLSPKHLKEAVGDKFPAKAAAFIEEHGYGGPLFNDFDWGGYLIWRLRHVAGFNGWSNECACRGSNPSLLPDLERDERLGFRRRIRSRTARACPIALPAGVATSS